MTQISKKYLDKLNAPQQEAVINTEGIFLVLAGAGSGKTRVLIYRLLHILLEKKALPNQILAVTFTNKAALEMKTRVMEMLKTPIDYIWLGTFHSLSVKILRKHAELVGLKSNFIILDTDDQLKIIKQVCEREKIDVREKTPKYYLNILEGYKNKSITFNSLKNFKQKKIEKDIIKIYNHYENELIRLNCADFGNLLLHCLTIFKNNKDILEKYQNQFKYILVDEYQDINYIQQLWLKYLYGKHKNICCVGDDDQSIYSWRGADIANILNYEKTFLKSKVIRLEQNYRSTQNILRCASSLITNNKGRYGKELWSANGNGEKITIRGFWETKAEALYISDEIEKLREKKITFKEIAILLRVSAHTRSFEERFINVGIPYKIIGGLRFYERKEIKDVIAYLRLVNNLGDDLAFERIINIPKRGIGQITLKKLNIIARKYNVSMFKAAERFVSQVSLKAVKEISNFLSDVNKWNKLKNKIHHEELVQIILEDSKYIETLEEEIKLSKNPEYLSRIDNIKEFIESLKEFDNLDEFLEHVGLVMENINDTSDAKICLMTMHSAKGLEFDYVFLAGWEEGVFPSKRSLEESGQRGLEEERRLAYVALTRPKKKLQITYVNQNRYTYASHDFNLPSRFIDELPKDIIDIQDSNYFANNNFIDEFIDTPEKFEDIITPGRKRLLLRSKKNEIEWDFNQDIYEDSQFVKGKKVFHKKYGYGRIINIEGDVANIKFDKSSQKQIFIKYLRLAC